MKNNNESKWALQVIIIFGIVSLMGDIVYEGARSVNGSYLSLLGVNAATVGLIAGIGEFLGYFIRLISGYFADKTKAYWTFTILGYLLLISVPFLSLTGIWQIAALLMIIERIGKALRSPAKDTLLSVATQKVGRGFGFGIHEALDQIGALIGPLIFSFIFLFFTSNENIKSISSYKKGYFALWVPFVLTIIFILIAYFKAPNLQYMEKSNNNSYNKLEKNFWIYLIFTFITTMGFASYAIIAFHLKSKRIVDDYQIPLLYAGAMVVDGIIAVIIGRLYDKKGIFVIFIIPILTLLTTPFIFSNFYITILIGIFIWGIVMGTHETIMKAAIADLTHIKKRSTGYGIFNTAYGLAMLVGTTLFGFLYEINIFFLIFFSVLFEIVAIGILIYMYKTLNNKRVK